ncbi:MAG: hypothetical protein C0621_06310 [Desulfuromonas sp.]|nr:MAG: hypothetical protein C0621_06310 [Desulfuromonas sp.]
MRLFSLLLLLLLLAAPVLADERYEGENSLFVDTVWEGEVEIDGILTVPPGVTLEIRPGTVVRFTPFDSNGDGIGEHELFVQGVLKAVGTAEAPILFTSTAAIPAPGDWGAINMMASEEENLLAHCRIEYGYRGFHAHFSRAALQDCLLQHNIRGAQFQESTVSLRRCQLLDNGHGLQFRNSDVTLEALEVARSFWGVRGLYSTVALRDSIIAKNRAGGVHLRDSTVEITRCRFDGNRRGLYLQRSEGRVNGNWIASSREYGILLEKSHCDLERNRLILNQRGGLKWVDAQGLFHRNDLVNNGLYAAVNEGTTPLDARGNWWGGQAPRLRDGRHRPGDALIDASVASSAPFFPEPVTKRR